MVKAQLAKKGGLVCTVQPASDSADRRHLIKAYTVGV